MLQQAPAVLRLCVPADGIGGDLAAKFACDSRKGTEKRVVDGFFFAANHQNHYKTENMPRIMMIYIYIYIYVCSASSPVGGLEPKRFGKGGGFSHPPSTRFQGLKSKIHLSG